MVRKISVILTVLALAMAMAAPALAGWEKYVDTVQNGFQGPCSPGYQKGRLIRTLPADGTPYRTVHTKVRYIPPSSFFTEVQFRVKEWRVYSGCFDYRFANHYYQYHETRSRTCVRFRMVSCGVWTSWG